MADDPTAPQQPAIKRGAVAVVVRDSRFLVIKRSVRVVAPGAFCFPGGGIEGHESEAEALVREFQEELGAVVQPLRLVWRSTTRWNVELAWWQGALQGSARLVPNPAEVESVHWLRAEEMFAAKNLLESNRLFLAALAQGLISLA